MQNFEDHSTGEHIVEIWLKISSSDGKYRYISISIDTSGTVIDKYR